MRLSGLRAVIAMSFSLSVVLCAHAFAQTAQRDGLLDVNAADDRIEARHREAASTHIARKHIGKTRISNRNASPKHAVKRASTRTTHGSRTGTTCTRAMA